VLYLIVHLVMLLANYIDRYNLLRVFVAPPHSDDSVARATPYPYPYPYPYS